MLFPTLQYRLAIQIHLNLLPARHANNIETAISQSNISVLKSLGAVHAATLFVGRLYRLSVSLGWRLLRSAE